MPPSVRHGPARLFEPVTENQITKQKVAGHQRLISLRRCCRATDVAAAAGRSTIPDSVSLLRMALSVALRWSRTHRRTYQYWNHPGSMRRRYDRSERKPNVESGRPSTAHAESYAAASKQRARVRIMGEASASAGVVVASTYAIWSSQGSFRLRMSTSPATAAAESADVPPLRPIRAATEAPATRPSSGPESEMSPPSLPHEQPRVREGGLDRAAALAAVGSSSARGAVAPSWPMQWLRPDVP